MNKKLNFKFEYEKIDIASGNPEEMVKFYSEVFKTEFEEITFKMNDKNWKRYSGSIGGIIFHLLPNETSGTEKGQEGIHQFHLRVENIEAFKDSAVKLGYDIKDCDFGEGKKQFFIRDPDGNPWIFS